MNLTIASEMTFNVNESLLFEPTLIDSSFYISFPNILDSLDIESFNKLKLAIETDSTSYFQLKLLQAYASQDTTTCIITKLNYEGNILNRLDSTYLNSLHNTISTKNILVGDFSYHKFGIIQYLITTPRLVVIKLFILNLKNNYQIDYIIPYDLYIKYVKYIESSIGSLNK